MCGTEGHRAEIVARRVAMRAVGLDAREVNLPEPRAEGASLAGPGEVLVSQTVTDLVAGSDLEFEDRGVHELMGIPGEWRSTLPCEPSLPTPRSKPLAWASVSE